MSTLRALVLLLALFAASALAQAPTPVAKHVQGEFSFSTGPAPDWVQVQDVAATWPAQATGDTTSTRWRNWLLDTQLDRRPGRYTGYYDQAFEPISSELVTQAAKFSIEFNPLYQTLEIHRVELRRDGKWSNRLDPAKISLARREEDFEENMSNGQVTALVLLADVRIGDVVRISYSITGGNPIIAGSQEDSFHIGWIDPVLDRNVRVLYSANDKVATRNFNTTLPVRTARVGDHQEISAHAHLVAGSRDEGAYPNWYTRFPMVQIAPERSWGDVVKWALPLYPDPGPLPAELEARVGEWSKISDKTARAFAVLRTVQKDVRYFGTELGENTHRPAPPAQTWEKRYGDCKDKAYLTVALLRRLGIDAEPALVSIEHGKATMERLPSAALFDHVIVRARIDGKSYWLDPTLSEQHGDLRSLDVHDYGAALPVLAGVDALVPVLAPGSTNNSITVSERFEPNAAGDTVDLQVSSVYTGQRAEYMRWRVNSEGVDELSRTFSDYYRKRYSDLSVSAPLVVDDPSDGDRLTLTEHYMLKNAWTSKLGQVRQIELYADGLAGDTALPSSIDRSGPLALARPSTLKHEITLVLPEGWSLVNAPENVQVKAGEVAYERQALRSPRTFELKHRLDILSDHVPAAHVAGFLRDLRQVGDEIGSRVSLQTNAGTGDKERKERLQKLLREAMDGKSAAASPGK